MGKKKEPVEAKKEEAPPTNAADEEEEDTPVIKQLKGIDDKFCAIEVELEKEIEKLRKKYNERQAPLVVERKNLLSDAAEASAEDKDFGTPACPEFWSQALGNTPDFEEVIHDCDEQVLKYLDDVQRSFPFPDEMQKAIRVEFHFKENPFFTNTVLFVEGHFDVENYKPYKERECIEVKSSTIDWKAGKNITVEKKKGDAGAKKGKKKPAKMVEQPVPSFFRIVFNSLKAGDPLPENLECIYADNEDVDDDDELSQYHLENIGSLMQMFSEQFVPYAVRYYTGEACEDDMDDDDEESEEEDDDDDESSDEESEEVAKPKKGGKKPAPKKGSGDAAGEKTEECKQQ